MAEAINVWKNARGFGKVSYPFRLFSNICAAVIIVTHHLENNLSISYFEYLSIASVIIIPHIFLIQFIRKGGLYKIATRQLTYDFFSLGAFLGVINLSVLPSFIFLMAIVINYISVKGSYKLHRLLIIPVMCLLFLSFQNFEIHLGYGDITALLSLSYGAIHFLVVAFVSFYYANRYQKGQKKLKAQKKEIEDQREEIILQAQKLSALNKSLKTLNGQLEDKVTDRTQQLQQKNRKLTEYAFINAHKLRAPVASIMGLVQLFDYEEQTKGQQEEIQKRLKNSTKELEQTISEIRRKLEGEGLIISDFNDNSTLHLNNNPITEKKKDTA